MRMAFILVNTMGGSKKFTSKYGGTEDGPPLPAGTHFVKTEELEDGRPIYRTVDDQGQIRGVDDPLAWKMFWNGGWSSWRMWWKDQKYPSYENYGNSKDPTDETGGDGKGWRINGDFGKSPAPQLKVGIVSGLCNCTILSCPMYRV